MAPNDVELHDAILQSLSVDFEAGVLTLRLDAYLAQADSQRQALIVTLRGVDDLTCVAEFASLATNRRAGNVNYWSPGAAGAPTFIYLNDGCIVIRAKQLQVELV